MIFNKKRSVFLLHSLQNISFSQKFLGKQFIALVHKFILISIITFLATITLSTFDKPVLAAPEEVTESVLYKLKPDGTAEVTFTLNLNNNYKWLESSITGFPIKPSNSSDMIISTKSMTIGDNPIDKATIKYTGLRFNNIKRGQHSYTLNVKLAEPYGQVFPMSFIGIQNRQRTTKISYPVSMGQPIRFTLNPTSNIKKNGNYEIIWNDSKKGWLFQIGDKQTYRVERIIKYRDYDNIAKTKQFIFPGSSLYAKGGITNKIPLQYADMDIDGNELASVDYSLNGKKIVYEAEVQYKKWNFSQAGLLDEIPENLIQQYTAGDGKYWDTENPQIKKIVARIKDPKKNVAQNIELLYKFTSEYIKYKKDFEIYRLQQRLTTAETLNNPENALCSEFANLLITLNRAAGIPSRLVIGWGDTGHPNKFKTTVLHAWVQTYIPNFGWVDFDPTWQQTSKADYFNEFDTNHVPFLILGKGPEWPAVSNLEAFITSDDSLISIKVVNKIGATKNIAQFPALVVPEAVIDLSGGSITSEVYDFKLPFDLPSFRVTLTREQFILLSVAGGVIVFIMFVALFFKPNKKRRVAEDVFRQSVVNKHTTPTISRITGNTTMDSPVQNTKDPASITSPNTINPPIVPAMTNNKSTTEVPLNVMPTPPLTPPTINPPTINQPTVNPITKTATTVSPPTSNIAPPPTMATAPQITPKPPFTPVTRAE